MTNNTGLFCGQCGSDLLEVGVSDVCLTETSQSYSFDYGWDSMEVGTEEKHLYYLCGGCGDQLPFDQDRLVTNRIRESEGGF